MWSAYRLLSVTVFFDFCDARRALLTSFSETTVRTIYFHPVTQVVMLGLVCFMCPGLYNALNGLGGGGRVDTTTNANANATHYATFAFFAFFAGQVEHSSSAALGTYTVRFGSFSQAHQQRPRTPTGSSYW